MKRIDVKAGTRFGRWTVIKEVEGQAGVRQFLCACDCGTERRVHISNLRRGVSQSCGCRWVATVNAGDRFGRWSVIQEVEMVGRYVRRFRCKCDCGTETIVRMSKLRYGESQSCGCLAREMCTTHGLSSDRIYYVWFDMMRRCYNSSCRAYSDYGGRGISVCKQWHDVCTFYKWAMCSGYKDDLTIEHVDNDGDYSPSNCIWIPQSQQQKNTRRSRRITFDGRTQILADWIRETPIKKQTVMSRLRLGWPIEKALTEPIKGRC